MGRVKDWFMGMEEDSHYLSRREFIEKHGISNLSIWDRINCISEKDRLDFEIRIKLEDLIDRLIMEHTPERLSQNILKNSEGLSTAVSNMLDNHLINKMKPIIIERLKNETKSQVECPDTIIKLYQSILDRKLKNKEECLRKYTVKLVHERLNQDFYSSNSLQLKNILEDDPENFMENLVNKITKTLDIKSISEENFSEIEKMLPNILNPVFSLFDKEDFLDKIDYNLFLAGISNNDLTQNYVLFLLEEINQEFTFEFMVAETLPYFKDLQNINTVIQEVVKNSPDQKAKKTIEPKEQHFAIEDGETGHTYESIFGDYLTGCKEITVVDPYIRSPHQINNFLRFCEVVIKSGDLKKIKLITSSDNRNSKETIKYRFTGLVDDLKKMGIEFSLIFKVKIHDRKITFDNGWIIKIGRGLDIYQPTANRFSIGQGSYEFRACKETEVDIYRCQSELPTRKAYA